MKQQGCEFICTVLYHIKLPLQCQYSIWTLAQDLAAPLPIQFLINMPEKTAKDSPRTWALVVMREALMKLLALA